MILPRFRPVAVHWALAAVLALTSACQTAPQAGGQNPRLPEAASAASLRAGDGLTVSLQGVPDPSTHAVQIDDQGWITLPFIGPVAAAGLTPAELSQRIRQTYLDRKVYTWVDVGVAVTERYVYVGGEVTRPGRIVWTPDLTVTTAVQSAGGFTLYARESRVSVVRDRIAYDINVALARRQPEEDPRLMPGDSINVPRAPF